MIAADAPAIPWLWDKTALVQSKNVNGVKNTYTTTPTSTSRRSSR